ncbi:MAG: tRNA modification GTPase, partial [Kosmotoga sp.]|nr:tRNA modification GTPase [Kosmotoga sp.]
EEILEALKSGITPDVVGSYLQQIIFIYDELTGRYSAEDLLDKIFGNFCVGK